MQRLFQQPQRDNKVILCNLTCGRNECCIKQKQQESLNLLISYLNTIKVEELQQWLCVFVLEIQKRMGVRFFQILFIMFAVEYNDIHHTSYIRVKGMTGLDIFKDKGFS